MITQTMPFEDRFDPDEIFDELMRPDDDERALEGLAKVHQRKRAKRRYEQEMALKVTTSMSQGGRGALISGQPKAKASAASMGDDDDLLGDDDDLLGDDDDLMGDDDDFGDDDFGDDDDLSGDDDDFGDDDGDSDGQGSRNENLGPLIAEREREHLQAIFNPLHNARQIAKELTLLEDHLIQPPQHCPDCIRKHLLRAEAYSDEAASLDEAGEYADLFGDVSQAIRGVSRDYLKDGQEREPRHKLAQRVRRVRKAMSKFGFHTVLESRMRRDAAPQPHISEPVGSANADAYGVKRKRTRTRVKGPRQDSARFGSGRPEGDPLSRTVGQDAGVVSSKYTTARGDVYDLESFLADKSLYRGSLDGRYGPGVRRGIEALQLAAALPVNGVFDQRLYQIYLGTGGASRMGNTQRSVPEALELAKRLARFMLAQDNLVKARLLTASERDAEKGSLGVKTEAAIGNFLARLSRSPKFSTQVEEAIRLPDDATLDVLLSDSNVTKAAASTTVEAPDPSQQINEDGARKTLEAAKLIWPGESDTLSPADFASAVKDFQFAASIGSNATPLAQSGVLDAPTQAAMRDGSVIARVIGVHDANPAGLNNHPWSKNARKPVEVIPGTATALLAMGVEEAQQHLNEAGATPALVTDGGFGTNTKAALRSFQQVAGLSVTGSLDQATIRALQSRDVVAKVKAKRTPTIAPAPAPAPVRPPPTPRPVSGPPAPYEPFMPPSGPLPAPYAPSLPPVSPALPLPTTIPAGYAQDPTGSYAVAFKAKFPLLAPAIDALMARERQLLSMSKYGASDDTQISGVARQWWSLSKQTRDPWPALHGAWLAGKAGDLKLAGQILEDVTQRFSGSPAAAAAMAQLASLPQAMSLTDTAMKAAPYIAAGAGLLLVAGLVLRRNE